MEKSIGKKIWAVAEGYIPEWSRGQEPEFESHGTLCFLNANEKDADVEITIFFEDEDPAGPYKITAPARRTKHVRFNNLEGPKPIPKGKDFASLVVSSQPVVVQHTRLDSRQAENALFSTMAFAND